MSASGAFRVNGGYTRWCLVLLMTCFSMTAQAAMRVTDLYEVGVPVTDKTAGERTRAMDEAFMQVMVRISGLSKVMQYQEVKEAAKRPSHYVQQYRYEKESRHAPANSTKMVEELILKVRFNEDIINQMLRRNGLPVWGVARPATLLWVAVDDRGERFLLAGDKGLGLMESFNLQARRRGLPLLYPLLDLEDQARISFVDVWGGFAGAIRAASKRYGVEAIATARLYRDGTGGWKARWMLFSVNDEQQWTADAAEVDVVLTNAVDKIADTLAAQYAIYSDTLSQSEVTLVVRGVHTLDDYARLNSYLQSSNAVARVQVKRVYADHVVYGLEIRGDVTGMERGFALDNILTPEMSATVETPPQDGAPLSGENMPLSQEGASPALPQDRVPVEDVAAAPVQASAIQLNYRLLP